MLVSADVKSLEVVTCAYLSRDAILMEEVKAGIDFHELNKSRFGLPDRVVAKRFKFKLIYGATAYGYANDSDFFGVSRNQQFWQEIIDEYYKKYKGIKEWHSYLVENAIQTGFFQSPTGRVYTFPKKEVVSKLWFWRPKILNYPVQGLGADLVMIARISAWNRIKNKGLCILPVTSVHDSIVFDTTEELWYNVGKVLKESVRDVPVNFENLFGKRFDLPLSAEIKVGQNLKETKVVNYD